MEEVLTVLVLHRPGYVLVTVAGEIDLVTAPRLRERLSALTADGGRVVVDLGRVRFIDASGLGVLATAASKAGANGGSLRVVTARAAVRRLFTISGLEGHLGLAQSVAEAVSDAGEITDEISQ